MLPLATTCQQASVSPGSFFLRGLNSDIWASLLLLLFAGCVSVKDARPLADAIDGYDGTSWHLPLPPLNATSLESYSPGAAHSAVPFCSSHINKSHSHTNWTLL